MRRNTCVCCIESIMSWRELRALRAATYDFTSRSRRPVGRTSSSACATASSSLRHQPAHSASEDDSVVETSSSSASKGSGHLPRQEANISSPMFQFELFEDLLTREARGNSNHTSMFENVYGSFVGMFPSTGARRASQRHSQYRTSFFNDGEERKRELGEFLRSCPTGNYTDVIDEVREDRNPEFFWANDESELQSK